MVPYIGTTLSELVTVSESQQTRLEDDLINFSKMRKVTTPSHKFTTHWTHSPQECMTTDRDPSGTV